MKNIANSVTWRGWGILSISIVLSCLSVSHTNSSGDARMKEFQARHDQVVQEKKAIKHRKIMAILNNYHTGLSKEAQVQLAHLIYQESRIYEYDPELILALMAKESSFYNWSQSRKGALGLMQILPATGEALAEAINIPWQGKKTLFDPHSNIRLGTHYLSKLHKRFGQLEIALTAYHYGPSRVSKIQSRRRHMPKQYASRILTTYREYMALDSGADENAVLPDERSDKATSA